MESRLKYRLAVAAALSLWAAQASAGVYVGASVGEATVEGDVDAIGDIDLDDSFDFDESDTAYKIYGGYMFNEFIGAEIGYVDFGKPNDSFGFDGGTAPDILVRGEAEITGFTASLLGQIPLGPVDLFAKLGLISYDAELNLLATDGVVTEQGKIDDNSEELTYGVGAKLNLGPVGLRVEYELYDVGDIDDLYMLSLGAQINF